MIRLENVVNGLDKRLEVATGRLDTEHTERDRSEQRLGKPFEHIERLETLRERQKEINRELLGNNEPQPENDPAATEAASDDAEFIRSAATHDAMANQMGGAAIVNGPNGLSIVSDRGRTR